MTKTHAFWSYCSTATLALSLSVSNSSIAQDQRAAAPAENWLESIIVIGEKTERSLKETTSSVSVISNEDLRTMQHHSISDAVGEVANVIALTGSVPDIRGVKGNGAAGGFNSISGGAKARVSTLIDGVAEPFVADLTGDSGIWDIEQIEVYRGPQSTSNGRNSIGGSIYIKTADPSFDWQGAARVGYRSEESYVDTSVMISGPIVDDKLAFRLTAQSLEAETLTDSTGYETNPAPYNLNEIDTQRIKGKLLWAINDETQLLLTHTSNNEQGDTGRVYYNAKNPWEFERIYFRDIETDSDTTSLKLDSRINDDMSIDVLIAHMDYQWGFDSYEPNPARQQQLLLEESSLSIDAKVNFGNNNKNLFGFLGLAYNEREQDINSNGAFAYFGDDQSDSTALYGEINFALNDKLTLLLGGRLERETQERNFTYLPIVAALDTDKTLFLPKLAMNYEFTDNTTLAFSARRGYNAAGGALNFTAQEYYYYDEETVDSYEFSLRTSSDDGQLHLTANGFYNNYDGYQAQSSSRFIINMDEAVTYGAELEALYRPQSSLEIKAGLGLLKTDIKDAGVDYTSATGNELNSAPEITASLSMKYWLNSDFNFGIGFKYVDEYYGDFENTDDRKAGNYTIARINANYETDHWTIAAFVNNAFDKKAFTAVEPPSRRYADGYVAIVQPRNLGISATYSF